MFTRDNAPGWGDNKNMYGQHPFYMGIEENGRAHGVFLLNSNAMEYLFTPSPALILRSIGGILDFYFIIEKSPMAVTQAYHKVYL
jgi:maltase-glucoamylase